MQRIDRSIALAGWLGSDVCHENPCHETPCHIAYVLLSGVITSLHNKYSISYRHQHFHPFEVGIPPPPDHPTSKFTPIDSSGKIPLWSRQQPRKRSGRRSHIKKSLNVVACREQLPRFCTLTALWTFSSIRLPLVPSFIFILELLFPSGIAPSSTIHFSAPPHNTAPSQLNLHVFQDAAETDESIFNCQCNRYPCYSREERYASQVINIKAKSARPILLHHA